MLSMRKWAALAAGVVTSAIVLAGQPASAAVNAAYSFERGLSGWQMAYEGDGAWDMARTTEQAYSGSYSIACYLDGSNGTGTAWMMRSYRAPMDTLVRLDMTFQLWSESAATVNNWDVVAYIGTRPPASRADFQVIGQTNMVAGWQQYRFERLQLTGQYPARVWVAFGVSSSWEYSREYYMDHVSVSLTP